MLLVDTFANELTRMTSTGWVITGYSRYDPTHIDGLTPTGRVFSCDLVDGTITVTVAGRVRTVSRAKALWEQGDLTVNAILEAWQLLPVNQR